MRRANIGVWIVAGAMWMAMGQNSGFVLCYAVGAAVWSYAGWLVVREDAEKRRRLARKDLREIYPPKRDQFQRDLERLNKLRAAGSSPATEVTVKRECTGSYDCTCMVKPKKPWHDRHTIAGPTYGAILEGFRDGCSHMLWLGAVVLVVAAVVGAGFLLGMGIGSLL